MSSINHISGVNPLRPGTGSKANGKNNEFQSTLSDALKDVNQSIADANDKVRGMTTGEVTDLHEVMIASEKANLGFEMVLELRNKLMDSYRELMRMQI